MAADPMDKTRHADDATLAYIAQLEKKLAAANARLAGIVEECARVVDPPPMTAEEYLKIVNHIVRREVDLERGLRRNLAAAIRALAPAVAEKVNAESALSEYRKFTADGEDESPLERLRFFLSLALKPQDWLDVECFLDDLPAPIPQPADGVVVECDKKWAAIVKKLLKATGSKVRSERMDDRNPGTLLSWLETADGTGICDVSNEVAALLAAAKEPRK